MFTLGSRNVSRYLNASANQGALRTSSVRPRRSRPKRHEFRAFALPTDCVGRAD